MMNATTRPAPASTRGPRPELFTPIHKAIRLAMSDVLARLGGTDFADDAASRAATAELRQVLLFCGSHLEHEERFVKPAAVERLPGGVVEAFEEHAEQALVVGELRALADAVDGAGPSTRTVTAHSLYLHFSRFVAQNLAHMADEEQVLAPLLERFFTPAEILEVHGRIQAAITPEERRISGPYMLRACSPGERRFLVAAMLKVAPKEAVMAALGSFRGAVPDATIDDLLAFCGGAS